MSGFVIRETTPDDFDAIARGYGAATGREEAGVRSEVRRTLGENPAGTSSLVAVAPGGEVVGHMGAAHVPMRVKDKHLTFGRMVACYLDPAFHIGGTHSVFVEMDETFQEKFEGPDGLALVFGWWNETDWWYLRHMRGYEAVLTSCELRRPPGPFDPAGANAEILRGDETTLTDWTEALEVGECMALRTGAYLSWRHGAPYDDRILCAHRNGRVMGCVVTRDEERNQRMVLDWAVEGEDEGAGRALMRDVIGDGDREVVLPVWTSRLWTMQFLQRLGFRVGSGDESYLAVRIAVPGMNQQWLADKWQVTASEMGLSSMPMMTAGEEIVTPPPSGTRTGRERHGY